MCRYRTLHLDEQLGYVLQCQDCASLTIGFNLLTFQFSPTEFQQVIRDIEGCIHYHQSESHEPCARIIPFWQLNDYTYMTVSINDLKQLVQLLNLSYAQLLVDELWNELLN